MSKSSSPNSLAHQPFAAALGRVTTGLYVLTMTHDGQETGMLASFVSQAGFEPACVTVAIEKSRPVNDWLKAGTSVVLNVLAAGDKAMLVHFGKGFAPGQPAFEGVTVDRTLSTAPVLTDAVAWLECTLHDSAGAGDHFVYIFEVHNGAVLSDREPAVHTRKAGTHY